MSQPKNFRSFYYTFFGKVLKSLILSDQAHYQLLQLRCSAPQLPCSEQDRRKEWLLWMLECSDLKTQLPSSSQFLPSVLASCAVSRRKTCPNCRVWNSTSPKSYGASWPKLLISGTSHVKLTPTSCRHLTSQKAAGHRLDVPPPALELLLSFGFLPHIRLCKVIKIYLNNNKAEPLQPKQHVNTSHGRSWDEFQGLCSCLVHTKSLSQHPEAFHPWVLNFLLLSIKLLAFSSHLGFVDLPLWEIKRKLNF